MAKQTLGQGDSNVVVRNQVVYGALPQDVIDRMGDTTLALQTTEQNVLPAINELKSNLTDLEDDFIVLSATTPSSANSDSRIVNDSTLYGNYIIAGYSIEYSNAWRTWYSDSVVAYIFIRADGIVMCLRSNDLTSKPIKLLLRKIS
jgi:hypothetical protein